MPNTLISSQPATQGTSQFPLSTSQSGYDNNGIIVKFVPGKFYLATQPIDAPFDENYCRNDWNLQMLYYYITNEQSVEFINSEKISLKEQSKKCRDAYIKVLTTPEGSKEHDDAHDEYKRLKSMLSSFRAAGTFPPEKFPNSNNIVTVSGLVITDIDHLYDDVPDIYEATARLNQTKQQLANDNELKPGLISTTCSGHGLRIVTKVPYVGHRNMTYKEACYKVMGLIEKNHKLEADTHCVDICRASFIVHDADALILSDNIKF